MANHILMHQETGETGYKKRFNTMDSARSQVFSYAPFTKCFSGSEMGSNYVLGRKSKCPVVVVTSTSYEINDNNSLSTIFLLIQIIKVFSDLVVKN